jgi:hypothetical protein
LPLLFYSPSYIGADIAEKHANSEMEAENLSEKLVRVIKPLRHSTPTEYKLYYMILALGINNVPYLYGLV